MLRGEQLYDVGGESNDPGAKAVSGNPRTRTGHLIIEAIYQRFVVYFI